jgi:type II secretory pathway pseudopilin PulG
MLAIQKGAALLIFMAIIAMLATAATVEYFSRANMHQLKMQKTQQSLAIAKQALLAYSSDKIDTAAKCGLNCPRPGDLPCPDRNNDGNAEISCNTQALRLGRLPWKTLGIDDIRDGASERLWYAVSERFKNNTRVLPLNSETLGAISLKDAQGNLIYDAANGSGLVAVIIAPNEILTRADNLQQSRSAANLDDPQHYLDIAANEDNADFVENNANGFVLGTLSQDDSINDAIMTITKNEINTLMEKRVLAEVMQAVLYNFCQDKDNNIDVDIKNRRCTKSTISTFFPDPALVTDTSCLGTATVTNNACNADNSVNVGRIPVSGNANWTADGKDKNSILRGDAEHNWFQQNGWRELIFYARAPACQETTKNCSGAGFLTLDGAITPTAMPSNLNKQMVLISAGSALATQTRANNADKTVFTNYIEGENFSPLNDTFARVAPDADNNDRVMSVP